MSSVTPDYISPEQAVTLHGLLLERARRTPDSVAYRHYDLRREAWVDLSWAEMRAEVARWQAALLREHLQKGDRVAIMLRNCPQWVMCEQAAMSLGLAVVPLYTVDRAENAAYIIDDAEVRVLLFETEEQWHSLRNSGSRMASLQRIVTLDRISAPDEPRLACADDWLGAAPAELRPEAAPDRNALATIIYTSGTTGKPKGVMLSHYNILYNAWASLHTFPGVIGSHDVLLSFLPLSHVFERTAGYFLGIMAGATVSYARSVPLLPEDFLIIRPTILFSVPRIYERVYNAIHAKLDEGPPLRKKLFTLAVDVGWDRFEYQQGRASWHLKLLLWPMLKLLVADKVLGRLGGRLRLSISGGAALPPKISRLFIALGLNLLQGYGMTETSPVVAVNRTQDNHPSTIGLPLEGIQVKIGDQDALLVKGPCNMLGYWNNPQATAAMIDAEGWLNTGDTARIDAGGHITITGRIKEIIVMSNGEKVPPADMEEAILRDTLFDQVMVYGEAKPTLVALAVVNPDRWQAFAREAGVQPDMPESLTDTRIEKAVLERIAAQITEFPGYAKVHRVLLLSEPWSIDNGMLTPTLKLKRPQVTQRYASAIQKLYSDNGARTTSWTTTR